MSALRTSPVSQLLREGEYRIAIALTEGACTYEGLCRALPRYTDTVVKAHLRAMDRAGLVVSRESQGVRLWELTSLGQSWFRLTKKAAYPDQEGDEA